MTLPVSLPVEFDRVIVHQFDPARPSPGGIDTCLRGIARYFPEGHKIAFIGVDTGSGPASRHIGVWEEHSLGGQTFWFLPAVKLDPANQSRRIPHSARLVAGILRYRNRIPQSKLWQFHRMDTAAALRRTAKSPYVYFVHTQENGLTGKTSDSFWRFTGGAHQRLERNVVTNAQTIVVFNESYSELVHEWNPRAQFSPTWFDPALITEGRAERAPYSVIWVGRLETPKDPMLAIHAFEALVDSAGEHPWTLDLLGSGTLLESTRNYVATLSDDMQRRITVRGRVKPENVAEMMASSGTFLMTSHPGYEGYPRVLVEAMASGLPAVVTDGSDTGNLVREGVTGFVTTREPHEMAEKLRQAVDIPRDSVISAVAALDAPTLVAKIFSFDDAPEPTRSK